MLITVYIVDDHPFVREGLKTFLGTQPEISVVGEAGNGTAALEELEKVKPDIAIVDLSLPGMGGIELTRRIRENHPGIQVVILSSFCEDEYVMAALNAGALSYLMKDSPPQTLVEAITAAQNGESVLHPRIAKKLIQQVKQVEPLPEPLTAKEKEVLKLMVEGKSNREIAGTLFVSETTVKTHVSNILRKLDVNDRTQAVIKALKMGLPER